MEDRIQEDRAPAELAHLRDAAHLGDALRAARRAAWWRSCRASRPPAAGSARSAGTGGPRRPRSPAAAGSRLPGGRHLSTLAMKHCSRAQADLCQQLVEQLAGLAHERLALLVLVEAGRLADEHQVGVGVAGAEHDVCCAPRPAGTSGSRRARGRGRPARRGGRRSQWQPQDPRSIPPPAPPFVIACARAFPPRRHRAHAERRHQPRGPTPSRTPGTPRTERTRAPAPRSGGHSRDRRTRRSAR